MVHKKIIPHFIPHFHQDGQHHRAHALSTVALISYLQLMLLVVFGFWIIGIKAPQILGTATFGADQIIALTNSKRAENGLGALVYNSQLAQAAAGKANDMIANDYWAHNSPSGKTPWLFINGAGYRYLFAGENLARDFSDADSVVSAWMSSQSHRDNILDKNFREIGVAVTNGKLGGKEGSLVVQMFGTRVSQAPTPTVAVASPSPLPTGETAGQQVALKEAKPSPTLEPSPSPTPTIEPVAQTQNPPNNNQPIENSQVNILATNQFSMAKLISLGLIGFIFALFAMETVVVLKGANLHLRSGIFAHLLLLGFVLLVLWYAVGGAIL